MNDPITQRKAQAYFIEGGDGYWPGHAPHLDCRYRCVCDNELAILGPVSEKSRLALEVGAECEYCGLVFLVIIKRHHVSPRKERSKPNES